MVSVRRLTVISVVIGAGSACGGGGGGGGGMSSGPATYAVGGLVSGLSGSGLVLQNNGADDLPKAATGSFAFATKLSAGAAYSVSVRTQPTGPSQTCTIQDGTGTIAATDVTSVAIDCTTAPGFSSSTWNGAYTIVAYDPTAASAAIWSVTFDRAGGFSGTATSIGSSGATSDGPQSGTYSVAADGSLTVAPAGGGALSGSLGADGGDSARLVLAQMTPGQNPAVAIGIKQGQSAFSNANLKGAFKQVVYNRRASHGALLSITFDGAGKFSYSEQENDSGAISSSADSGTYTVTASGTLTMFVTGSGFGFTGGLSADGETLVLARTTAGLAPSLTFAVKESRSPLAAADVAGTYTAIDYESAGDFGALSTLTADGSGSFTVNEVRNHSGTITNASATGTYSVDATGALTLTVTGGSTSSGGVSSNGKSIVLTGTTSGVAPSLEFAIK